MASVGNVKSTGDGASKLQELLVTILWVCESAVEFYCFCVIIVGDGQRTSIGNVDGTSSLLKECSVALPRCCGV